MDNKTSLTLLHTISETESKQLSATEKIQAPDWQSLEFNTLIFTNADKKFWLN